MKLGKACIAIVGATVLMAAVVGTASAGRLSTSSQPLRATFSSVTFQGAFGRIVCPVTVEGSFHARTISKVVESLAGYVTSAALGACASGSATLLRETMPWHIRYSSFTGTLPRITTIVARIVGTSFQVREPLFTCLARATAERPGLITFNRETATGVINTANISGTIPSSCGVDGTFSSVAGPVTVQGAATRITITLI